jgi:hypothetical protein
MSFTLRQVQPLLTKPELELFQASRAGAVKDIAPHRLTSKIQRARALRDKYRDVYQRQTVQTRAGEPKSRKALGGENTRTQTKSEIMDEVLKRFEAQQDKLQRKLDASNASPARSTVKAKPATKKAVAPRTARRTSAKPPASGADLPMRGASASTPRQRARQTRAVQKAGEEVVQSRSKKATPAARAPAAKSPAKKSTASTSSLASGVKRLQNIVKAVRKAVATGVVDSNGKPGGKRPPSDTASDAALSSAPTDITPKTQRVNPLKAKPVNKKIHATARSRTRAVQAKRDAR